MIVVAVALALLLAVIAGLHAFGEGAVSGPQRQRMS